MQLRPRVANFGLSSENTSEKITRNLDISMFERLCTGGPSSPRANGKHLLSTQLTVQRRMRPEIADLVRVPLYPELLDHDGVKNYSNVVGVYPPVYWIDHSNHEDQQGSFDKNETSRSNKFEVQMTIRLVLHLKKQGCYKRGDVAILTPYLGQLRKLRDELKTHVSVEMSDRDENELGNFERGIERNDTVPVINLETKPLTETVRLATVYTAVETCYLPNQVDNFQGEEAKVIVISLVRSNPQRNVGFLKTVNRINVLLR